MDSGTNMFKLFHKKSKGSALLVVALVSIAVALIVGLIITSQLQTIANGFALGTTGNATRVSLFSNIYNAMNLLVILPIVMGAGAILAYLMGWGRGKG